MSTCVLNISIHTYVSVCACLHTYVCVYRNHTPENQQQRWAKGLVELSIIFCMPVTLPPWNFPSPHNSLGATVTILYSDGHLKDGETGTRCRFLTQKYSPLFTAGANTWCHSVQVLHGLEFEGKAPLPNNSDLSSGGRLQFSVPGEAASHAAPHFLPEG